MFNFEEIIAAALRDHPEDEIFRTWLVGPKPVRVRLVVREQDHLIPHLARLYPCGVKLNGLMIRAGQDLSRVRQDPGQTRKFLTSSYIKWHRSFSHNWLFDHVANEKDMQRFMTPILPEGSIRSMSRLFPTVESAIDLCDRSGIVHRWHNPHIGERSAFALFKMHGAQGVDLWTEIYRASEDGWVLDFEVLVLAALIELS